MARDYETSGPRPGKGLRAAYHTYFASGHYDRRYPSPNRSTWRRLLGLLPEAAHVIDFGCGSGRYLLPLRPYVARAAGYDISATALDMLRARASDMGWADLHVLGPEKTALTTYVADEGCADVVLCLFGVLGHIADPLARAEALNTIHACLEPECGVLLLSVPNQARRFFAEQRAAGPEADGLIRYERQMDDTHVTLPYQLYDPARLRREIEAAGFTLLSLRAESVLPESWLLNYAVARWLDWAVTPFCPAAWGYGLIAEARA